MLRALLVFLLFFELGELGELWGLGSPLQAKELLEGTVIRIADGDTLTLKDENHKSHKIRLQGIDAPERNQPFGKEASLSLKSLVFEKKIRVELKGRDRYGRWLGKVRLKDQDINLEQIRKGLAWHYKRFQRDQTPNDRKIYSDEEVLARKAKRGLWKRDEPTPPWKFRGKLRRKRKPSKSID